jgi:hypothetical protein
MVDNPFDLAINARGGRERLDDGDFVIMASRSLDPKMVVPAPPDIDEAMVFNPESRGRSPLMAPPTKLTPKPYGVPPRFGTPTPPLRRE